MNKILEARPNPQITILKNPEFDRLMVRADERHDATVELAVVGLRLVDCGEVVGVVEPDFEHCGFEGGRDWDRVLFYLLGGLRVVRRVGLVHVEWDFIQ
jgi:hypothetical protein